MIPSLPFDTMQALLRERPEREGRAELFLKESLTRHWSLAEGVISSTTGHERGSAARVVLPDGRSSLVTSATPTDLTLDRDLQRARLLAGRAAPDPHLSLPGAVPGQQAVFTEACPPPDRHDSAPARLVLERLGRPGPGRIAVRQCWLQRSVVTTALANSAGFAGVHRLQVTTLGVLLAAGDRQPLVHQEVRVGGEAPDLDRFLERALDRAGLVLGPQADGPGSPATLVLTPEAAATMLRAIGSRFVSRPGAAEAPPPPWPGTRVARNGITLEDQGRHPNGLRSAAFDGEGTPTGTTVLVRDGIFETMVHDRRSAAISGTTATGNAVRDSYRQLPSPDLTTLLLRAQPDITGDDLTSDVSRGLHVVEASPPDPDRLEAGLFSCTLRGRLIGDGRLLSPARPVGIQLPLEDLLPRISASAGPSRMVALDGCVEAPSIRLDGVRLES